ncbi:hypothetical protein GE21DRAFT_324 [Neurospora crassa]|uniref:G-patch domain-containing protein n=1 Tax=Neurospora crassa (strain ATCC 24698 / 74-OR23-1A / CBS 708.71 / DSM 1257 / FGSC 987) TaxID=367110 RepID=Q7SDM7_NEUCR|nr:hypothetical protein NCU02106 [Neurospora crassa OR74A]EAA34864.1 hypothetical protein NCU02106 [Neurospora crassa OR74A]KAK3500792.1 hypothetical protein B0T13DRAFT_527176 [Neurospora crassa]KHE80245.1 hypothetical protein GE21DRAFT_324 [Neurospora crassa]|eukprot:XP_964100.1 hypothetical protein NCU02106 [Neurospora crassa OR74A]
MSTSTPKYGERLLKSQGWRGKGYSLHPTDNTIGLSNPLRISRNTDGRGIGQSTHYTSDQWWLAAFDEKLKGLDTSKDGKVVQTTTQSKLDAVTANIGGGKYTGAGGLYASFVRGEGLAGTVESSESGSGRSTPTDREDVAGLKGGVKKHRESGSNKKKAEKEEKKRRKAMEKLKKKEEKKAAKKAAKKEEKRRRKATETKEERKARKKERRAKKEEKRRKRTSEK